MSATPPPSAPSPGWDAAPENAAPEGFDFEGILALDRQSRLLMWAAAKTDGEEFPA
ncbi:MAG: hypothetical protein ACREJ2_13745 [Planctomycetota bacterium]